MAETRRGRERIRNPGTPTEGPVFTLQGRLAGSATSVDLEMDGAPLVENRPGIPCLQNMLSFDVAVGWISSSTPAGNWTLRLWRRKSGEAGFIEMAQFPVVTS